MMPPVALTARSLLRSAARPGPAPRWLRSGPAQSPVSTGVSSGERRGRRARGDLGGSGGEGAAPAVTALCPQDTVLGLAAVFASFFVPAAWVLGHIQDYKKREE